MKTMSLVGNTIHTSLHSDRPELHIPLSLITVWPWQVLCFPKSWCLFIYKKKKRPALWCYMRIQRDMYVKYIAQCLLNMWQMLINNSFWLLNFIAPFLILFIFNNPLNHECLLFWSLGGHSFLVILTPSGLLHSPPLPSIPLPPIKCGHSPGFSPPSSSLDFLLDLFFFPQYQVTSIWPRP